METLSVEARFSTAPYVEEVLAGASGGDIHMFAADIITS